MMAKNFRYDINTLRAIAVLGVVAFHYGLPFAPGGFAGVDVFFVISGYLMSRIIIGGLTSEKFSLVDFYAKRLKRIVPALLFLIAVISVACFFICFPLDYRLNEKNASASILFVSNIVYERRLNYFNPASDRNFFLHTWSLSAEWQFYMLYPAILMLLAKRIRERAYFTYAYIAFAIAIFIASVFYTRYDATPSFYLLPSRSWEMLAGGVAYLAEGKLKAGRFKILLALAGYVGIFACFFFFDTGLPWPDTYTLVPVLATFLVIIANCNGFSLLKFRPIQFLGTISYSLYLWHWPVLVIAKYIGLPLNLISISSLFLISTALAYISYRYVESLHFRTLYIMLAAPALLLVTLGLSFYNSNGFMFKPKTLSIAKYAYEDNKDIRALFGEDGCFVNADEPDLTVYNKTRCLRIEKGKKNILLIGDSHAADLSQPLIKRFKEINVNLIHATAVGCLPILRPTGVSQCTQLINYIYYDFIEKNANQLDGVILSANWVNSGPNQQAALLSQLNETISFLAKRNLKTVIIGQSEIYNIPYPIIAARENEYAISIRQNSITQKGERLNLFMQKNLGPYYVAIYNKGQAPAMDGNGTPYMFDENHFTLYGAKLASDKIFMSDIMQLFLKDK